MTAPSAAPSNNEWTTETLRQFILELMAANNARYYQLVDERNSRYEQRFTEMDLRYQQRYDAQIKALDAALLAAEKAVQTALLSSKEAVNKAETAAEKRFESVNEFRAQLVDQAATFMPRLEAETRIAVNNDKIGELGNVVNILSARFDRREGESSGHSDSTKNLVTIIGIALTAITIIVAIYLGIHK